ncbi:MAG: S41 family peptidase [Bacteroidetes bacterium]|nr:S41 family peptidase [Bacteroidota bacterium]
METGQGIAYSSFNKIDLYPMKLFFYCLFFLFFNTAFCQSNGLTYKEKKESIDSLSRVLIHNYFDTTKCKGLVKVLQEKLRQGFFDSAQLPIEFESSLDNVIRQYTQDDHFKVIYDEKWVEENSKLEFGKEVQKLQEIEEQESRKINYGFKEVKVLGGNIGYIKFTSFENPEFAASTLANAVHFISNTDAVILDLRNNTGGYTEMMTLVCSYFLNTNEDWYTPLTEMHLRKGGKDILIQTNALAFVGATKLLNQKLYILTNYRTFSAAEWTSFVLKNRKRAIIVGEKTAGGTHPANQFAFSNKFSINIPIGTMIDAVTKTHFEGIGVTPDIVIPANDALTYAQIDFLKNAINDSAKTANKKIYEWHLMYLNSLVNPIHIFPEILAACEGKYGNIELKLKNGKLYSVREGITTELVPVSNNIFRLMGRDDLRIKVIELNKKIIAIERMLDDGTVLRTNKG